MKAEYRTPDGALHAGYYCTRCGRGPTNMVGTGHGSGKCDPDPARVEAMREANATKMAAMLKPERDERRPISVPPFAPSWVTHGAFRIHLSPNAHPEDFYLQAELHDDARGAYVCQMLTVPGLRVALYLTVDQFARLAQDMEAASCGINEQLDEAVRDIDLDAPVHELVSCGDCGTTHAAGANCPGDSS